MPLGGRINAPAGVSDESVDSDAYVDGSIDTAHIADNQVTVAKLEDIARGSIIIGNASAASAELTKGAANTVLISDGTDVAYGNITSAMITDATIAAADLASNAVTTAKINADAVTSAKIADDAIDSEHYADGSIDTAHIADNQVTAAKIFDLARGSILIGNASAATAELTIGSNTYVLSSDGTDISWTSAPAASGAQTGITTILNTGVKIGRDTENLIDFATTDNKIILRVNNVNEVELVENALSPVSNDGVALGTTSLGWSDAHLAAQGVINWANGEMTITETSANLLTIAGGAVTSTAASLSFDSAVADENVSGITASFTAGEDLVRGEVVYFKAGDSKMWKAVATASGTMPVVAMAAEDISADAAGLFLLQGFCRDDGTMPAYTVGGRLYAPEAETSSENVPEQAQPDSDGDFVQDLGFAVTANILYFKPGETVVEIA